MDFAIWLILVVVVVLVAFLPVFLKEKVALFREMEKATWGPSYGNPKALMSWIGVWSVLVIATVSSPLYYEFPSHQHQIFSRDIKTGKISEHPWGTFEWGKDIHVLPIDKRLLEGKHSKTSVVSSQVSFMTENPKMRTIFFELNGKIYDPVLFIEREGLEIKGSNAEDAAIRVREILEYWMHVFNHMHSKELTQFYNPLDKEQDRQFVHFVESWFTEHTEKSGFKTVASGFTIR